MISFFLIFITNIFILASSFLGLVMPLTATLARGIVDSRSPETALSPIIAVSETATSPKLNTSDPVTAQPSTATTTQNAPRNTPKTASDIHATSTLDIAGNIGIAAAVPMEPYLSAVNTSNIKAAVVNIICIAKDPRLSSMTASGVLIDPQGIILTNAHVGQYFLFTDYMKNGLLRCIIRGGNPAASLYTAELLYIPAKWVENNASLFTDDASHGNGEDDFALLRITGTVSGGELESPLPYIPYSTNAKFKKEDPLVAAAYPAEFIDAPDITKNLYDLSIFTKIDQLLTFKSSTVDLFRMKGSIIAQRGSSGGAVVNETGALIGIIATASEKFYDNERNLYALTIPYINRELETFTNEGLENLLSGNMSRKAVDFSLHNAPRLRKLLEEQLDK